ncbi:hypothetical protein WT54_27495 [Burkholderia territorii]|nr:hypothetical protein WT54_27495 [Burkholderia territorii]
MGLLMDVKTENSAKKHVAEWPWAAIVLVIGWIGFWIFYSSGDAYYRALMSFYSVNADGFPIDQYRHFVLSAFSGLNFLTVFADWSHKNKKIILVLLVAYLLFLLFVVLAELANNGRGNKLAKYVGNHRVLRAIRDVLVAWYVFPISMIFLSVSLTIGATLPSAFAEATGTAVAENALRDYKKGCDKSRERCQVALKNGTEIARGYVIAQSPTRIALFENGNTVQIPLDGVELRTVPLLQEPAPLSH